MSILKYSSVLCVILLFSPRILCSQEANRPLNSSASSTYPYQGTSDGLQQLLESVLEAAKRNDRPKIAALVSEMEIPDFETWFTKTFGKETGESRSKPYGRELHQRENELIETFIQYGKQDGEIFTRKVNDAPDPRNPFEPGIVDSLKRPVDIFFASWKRQGSPPSNSGFVGYFVFVDGKFRWDSTIISMNIRTMPAPVERENQSFTQDQTDGDSNDPTNRGKSDGPYIVGANGVGYPSCTYCPDPEYPPKARAEHAEGVVVLQAIIQRNGRAANISVVKSPRADLTEAAIRAVGDWHFKPAPGPQGVPVAVIVPIEVTFRLVK